MTVVLEFTDEIGPIQRNFDKLAALVVDAGEQSASIRFGTASAVFAAQNSRAVTVTHGLGKVPTVIFCMTKQPALSRLTVQESAAATATDFTVTLFQTASNNVTGTQDFYWLVIG